MKKFGIIKACTTARNNNQNNKTMYVQDDFIRKVKPIFFMVDTSGSMGGAKIESLNTVVCETLNEVGERAKCIAGIQIKVAVLQFSSDVSWMYDKMIEAESFKWKDLTANGLTNFGAACEELDKKLLESNGWITDPTITSVPSIILVTDGDPTDEWQQALEKLKSNQWFKVAVKVAIAMGDDFADRNVLADFTGHIESVVTVHDVKQLKKIIHTVSVTSAMFNLKSSDVGTNTSGNGAPAPIADPTLQVIDVIQNDINTDPTLNGVDMGESTANAGTDDWWMFDEK